MPDPRHAKLADVLVGYSCALREGEKVLINAIDCPEAMVRALIRSAADAGAVPLVLINNYALMRDLMLLNSEALMRTWGAAERFLFEQVQAYVGIRGNPNISEWSDVPDDAMGLYKKHVFEHAHLEVRVPKTRWCVLRWPSPSMAQQAEMSTEAFEDFYFDVCTLDYARMSKAMQPLKELMEKTDQVRLVAPGTDLRFSIAGIPAVSCDGRMNLPDGEVYTAPVRDSINGRIQYNTPTIYYGVTHRDVGLEFRDGKVVNAWSSAQHHLEATLDTDEGARYTGEFAIGFNPLVTKPMKDILFDEKIAGSIHLTPGNAYDDASNGNRSRVHWDLVLRMTPDAGGGEIYFDDRLIRKDGLFVVPELEGLNPDKLLGTRR